MNSLIKQNLPTISLPPHSMAVQSEGQLLNFNHQFIRKYLNKKQIPVLFGDILLDDKWGCSILSGDTIVSVLAKKLGADQVIFLSDVDGIFDKDPNKHSDAKLIGKINNKNLNQVLKGLTASNRDDVTGEMKGKILNLKRDLANQEIIITNGFNPKILEEILEGNPIATKLLFE